MKKKVTMISLIGRACFRAHGAVNQFRKITQAPESAEIKVCLSPALGYGSLFACVVEPLVYARQREE